MLLAVSEKIAIVACGDNHGSWTTPARPKMPPFRMTGGNARDVGVRRLVPWPERVLKGTNRVRICHPMLAEGLGQSHMLFAGSGKLEELKMFLLMRYPLPTGVRTRSLDIVA
jgi:hypothetical protein